MKWKVILMKILVVNGPNLNFLGKREIDIYGKKDYNSLVNYIKTYCHQNNIEVIFFQSNSEGAIIDKLYEEYTNIDGIVINGGAYAHTSIAIMDCIKGINIPTINVHLTNVNSREHFRHIDYLSMVSLKTFMGKGFDSYIDAIVYLKNRRDDK